LAMRLVGFSQPGTDDPDVRRELYQWGRPLPNPRETSGAIYTTFTVWEAKREKVQKSEGRKQKEWGGVQCGFKGEEKGTHVNSANGKEKA